MKLLWSRKKKGGDDEYSINEVITRLAQDISGLENVNSIVEKAVAFEKRSRILSNLR